VGERLIVALAFGALAGSLLQLAVQLPSSLRLAGRLTWGLHLRSPDVRRVLTAWGPVVAGAGVVQISSVVDTQLASLLGAGAVAVLGYAQLVALLPISLFGVSLAAAALPALSRDAATDGNTVLGNQVQIALRRITFFVVPAAYAFAAFGREVLGALFQTGRFGPTDTEVAAGVLAAYAIGLPAQASVKLLASAFYAVGDTKTPVRIAVVVVTLSAALAAAAMQVFGPAGIALGAAVAAYVNIGLLLRGLAARVGTASEGRARTLATVLAGALAGTGCGLLGARVTAATPLPVTATVALTAFGIAYLAVTAALGHPEARGLLRRWTSRAQA